MRQVSRLPPFPLTGKDEARRVPQSCPPPARLIPAMVNGVGVASSLNNELELPEGRSGQGHEQMRGIASLETKRVHAPPA